MVVINGLILRDDIVTGANTKVVVGNIGDKNNVVPVSFEVDNVFKAGNGCVATDVNFGIVVLSNKAASVDRDNIAVVPGNVIDNVAGLSVATVLLLIMVVGFVAELDLPVARDIFEVVMTLDEDEILILFSIIEVVVFCNFDWVIFKVLDARIICGVIGVSTAVVSVRVKD